MRLVKAYVRTHMANEVVTALEKLNIHRVMLVHVEEIGEGIFKKETHLETSVGCQYTEMIKIELVCPNEELDHVKQAIISTAKTGYKGDGLIAVSKLEEAISIRTGEMIAKDNMEDV
ncbi:hypothetical protein MNBD_UNCLBAC01-1051 [hydrothermal vent metagenome]|uniref:Nitrogen regulatory protein P-II n=1 Tax=hydrothermal vent metagenome TaxID=652676 RepID=A0A3B1D153_9ZZZZ